MTEANNASELDILYSTRTIEIAGKTIKVHELTFSEQLQVSHLLKPIAVKFDAINLDDDSNASNIIYDTLAEEADNLIKLLAICTNQPVEWVKSLSPEEGELLMVYWWSVNSNFFIRRQLRKSQAIAMETAQKIKSTLGETLLAPLSEQATTGATLNDITPTVK